MKLKNRKAILMKEVMGIIFILFAFSMFFIFIYNKIQETGGIYERFTITKECPDVNAVRNELNDLLKATPLNNNMVKETYLQFTDCYPSDILDWNEDDLYTLYGIISLAGDINLQLKLADNYLTKFPDGKYALEMQMIKATLTSDPNSKITELQKIIDKYSIDKNPIEYCDALQQIAILYEGLGDRKNALDAYQKYLNVADKCASAGFMQKEYVQKVIGKLEIEEQIESADEEGLKDLIKQFRDGDNTETLIHALYKLGELYFNQAKYIDAENTFNEAIEEFTFNKAKEDFIKSTTFTATELFDKTYSAESYFMLAETYRTMGLKEAEADKQKEYYNKAIDEYENYGKEFPDGKRIEEVSDRLENFAFDYEQQKNYLAAFDIYGFMADNHLDSEKVLRKYQEYISTYKDGYKDPNPLKNGPNLAEVKEKVTNLEADISGIRNWVIQIGGRGNPEGLLLWDKKIEGLLPSFVFIGNQFEESNILSNFGTGKLTITLDTDGHQLAYITSVDNIGLIAYDKEGKDFVESRDVKDLKVNDKFTVKVGNDVLLRFTYLGIGEDQNGKPSNKINFNIDYILVQEE